MPCVFTGVIHAGIIEGNHFKAKLYCNYGDEKLLFRSTNIEWWWDDSMCVSVCVWLQGTLTVSDNFVSHANKFPILRDLVKKKLWLLSFSPCLPLSWSLLLCCPHLRSSSPLFSYLLLLLKGWGTFFFLLDRLLKGLCSSFRVAVFTSGIHLPRLALWSEMRNKGAMGYENQNIWLW